MQELKRFQRLVFGPSMLPLPANYTMQLTPVCLLICCYRRPPTTRKFYFFCRRTARAIIGDIKNKTETPHPKKQNQPFCHFSCHLERNVKTKTSHAREDK
nr:hypothetical protein CFP56_52924 [Quercus suber]